MNRQELHRQLVLLDYMIVQYRISIGEAQRMSISLGFNPDTNTHILAMRRGLHSMQEEFDGLRLQDTMTAFGGPT